MKKKKIFFKRYIASNSDVYTGTVVVIFFHLLHSNLLRITFVSSMLCVIASTCVITSIVPFLALHVGHTFVHTETWIGKKKNQYEIEIHLKKKKIKSLQISVNVHIKICLTRVISRVRTVVELSLISISLPRHGHTNSQQTRRPKSW